MVGAAALDRTRPARLNSTSVTKHPATTVAVDPALRVRIGHWTDTEALTGCTVVLLPRDACGSFEVRGGAPATRELQCLEPDKSVSSVDAVLLTGGSVFGLAAADGVVTALAARDRGVPTPGGPVPIVPTLGLFDLGVGDPTVRPTAASGAAAVEAAGPADSDVPDALDQDRGAVQAGQIGAGTGAYSSQWRGPDRRPGGIRYAERRFGDVVVGALVAVNSFGDIVGADGRADPAEPAPLAALAAGSGQPFDLGRAHTTIGAVVTNAALDKQDCRIVAQGAHDGLARAITPPHSRFDGDGFVAVSTAGRTPSTMQEPAPPIDVVRLLALGAVCDAIHSAVH